MMVDRVSRVMSVIAEFTADGSAFAVGRALAVTDGATVDLERVVPVEDGLFPYCRVRDESGPGVFAEALAASPAVDTVTHLPDGDDGDRFRVTWTASAVDEFVEALVEHDGRVLSASARDGHWRLRLQFPTGALLADFQRTVTAADVQLDTMRVYTTDEGADPDFGLTAAQLDALVTAVETGYFRVPREISTVDLGALLGISGQAVSERIRRGVETLTRNALNVPEQSREDAY
jgi:predicted DNA binding protein